MSKIVVIGAGYWGPYLLRNFMSLGAYDEVIACELNPDRLRAVCKKLPGLRGSSDAASLFRDADVEAVAIATAVRFHHGLAKTALLAGKHVLIEKPMTENCEQARELIELAGAKGLVLMVDHTFLYNGAVEKIAEIVSQGKIGTMYYVDSVRVNLGVFQEDVNVMWDLAPHDLSIVNHVLKMSPKVVRALGRRHAGHSMVDVAYINVEYDEHISANFHVNWLSPIKIRRMIFAGSQQMIVWDDLQPAESVRVYDKGIQLAQVGAEDRANLKVGYRTGDIWSPRIDTTEPLAKMAQHFVDCCRNGARPISGGANGLEVISTLEAAELSLTHGGRPVAIEGEKFVLV